MAHVTYPGRGHNNSEDLELMITSASDTVGEDQIIGGYNNRDSVTILMDSIQKDLKQVPSLPPNCSLFRVPTPLRKVKPEAYTPRMVSIGPYHRSEKHLQPMEAQKLRCLNDFLCRESPATLDDYVKAMIELEEMQKSSNSNLNEFVKIMTFDGCFILELIIRTNLKKRSDLYEPKHRDDPILNATWMSYVIKGDLILLENQLPFFVLEHLYNLFTGNSYSNGLGSFTSIACLFFEDFVPQPQTITAESSRFRPIFEVAKNMIRRSKKEDQVGVVALLIKAAKQVEEPEDKSQAKHLLAFVRDLLLQSPLRSPLNPGDSSHIRSATELHEASVKFEKGLKPCLSDIKFNNGVLKIPTMKIENWTEPLLRNLIAFEDNYITAYAAFIDGLINSPKDVELLQKKETIESLLGDPKELVALFTSLLK
ncbi:UPF0481 protein At3g47200-like [Macadamia integrifolia]|uniref:UPF0481 protein At3g47200-like n=1 Tax=Macadamia integrifolia TaxID=60698 RepID=UPI001C4FF68F|nr:UPF0481 protein At3g47200-like [Macadamia integrifolia]XP_042512715.1 UPF0481 protein At3g47200-like [Macadamia integrifolia]